MRIQLTQGLTALVDDITEYIKSNKWYPDDRGDGNYYVFRLVWMPETSSYRKEYLHRVLIGAQPGQIVDHINRKTHDCRIENLRIVNGSQSRQNTRKPKKYNNKCMTSKYKGVSWDSTNQKWYACIGYRGKSINLGRYKTQIAAARAYNQKALQLYGPKAAINKLPKEAK